mmetsp:Transcript_35802/g.105865  ORF Transcript_35802/g.105865 Transcript_35802/m.105865 type:complete len:228 (-) Transcript_35802:448-1131(-)
MLLDLVFELLELQQLFQLAQLPRLELELLLQLDQLFLLVPSQPLQQLLAERRLEPDPQTEAPVAGHNGGQHAGHERNRPRHAHHDHELDAAICHVHRGKRRDHDEHDAAAEDAQQDVDDACVGGDEVDEVALCHRIVNLDDVDDRHDDDREREDEGHAHEHRDDGLCVRVLWVVARDGLDGALEGDPKQQRRHKANVDPKVLELLACLDRAVRMQLPQPHAGQRHPH